jgi:hypothetical protein
MSYRSATDIDVASRALVMAGTKAINSFEDGTVEADVARLLYEDVAALALTMTTWRFTMTQATMSKHPTPPIGRGATVLQIPLDCLQIRAVTVNDNPIIFERFEQHVYSKQEIPDNNVAVLEYSRRVETSSWPPYFVPVVQHLLASEFAIAIGQNEDLSVLHASKADVLLRSAKSIDAQGRTNSVLDTKRFIRTRRT